MAIEVETAEIQLDVVGQEAVQQTLDALGVQADQVNSASEINSPQETADKNADRKEFDQDESVATIDAKGIDAVQQTLDALLGSAGARGVSVESPEPEQETPVPGFDFSGLMSIIKQSNQILERIATAVESPPAPSQPTY